jgi:hypothetical protein
VQHASKQGDVGKIRQVATNLREEFSAKEAVAAEEAGKAETHGEKVIVITENLKKLVPEGQEVAEVSREDVAKMTDEQLHEITFQCAAKIFFFLVALGACVLLWTTRPGNHPTRPSNQLAHTCCDGTATATKCCQRQLRTDPAVRIFTL